MKNQNYQTKTASILAAIVEMMEIRPDEITIEEKIQRANIATGEPATLFLWVAPRWKEDFGLLVGNDGSTFKGMRTLLELVAGNEGLVLRWKQIEKPAGEAASRPKATRVDIEELRDLATLIADGVFGKAAVTVESVGDFFEVTYELVAVNPKKIVESLIGFVIGAIAKSRAVQIAVRVESVSAYQFKKLQAKS